MRPNIKWLYLFVEIILVILSVVFITLIERKLVGLNNNRLSINSTFLFSLFHSIVDFVKLVLKKIYFITFINLFLWINVVLIMFILIFLLREIIFLVDYFIISLNLILLFVFFSISVYVFIFINWSSIRIFRKITLFRSLVQIISYECLFSLLFIIVVFLTKKFNFFNNTYFFLFFPFFCLLIVITFLCEARRQPFDFIECESELVSGFNLEYFSVLFRIIFLFEYFVFIISIIILFNLKLMSLFIILLVFLHVRLFFPRLRYDKMITFFWKDLLFFIFIIFFFIFFFVFRKIY